MTERAYRFILGLSMISFLLLQWDYAIYGIISILLFEGITNWRVPILISQIRYAGKDFQVTDSENEACALNFEAERFLRFAVSFFIILGFVAFPKELWFFPWFVGLNLLLAGISGICPMVMLFRKSGLR
jgi:hypothetical protein